VCASVAASLIFVALGSMAIFWLNLPNIAAITGAYRQFAWCSAALAWRDALRLWRRVQVRAHAWRPLLCRLVMDGAVATPDPPLRRRAVVGEIGSSSISGASSSLGTPLWIFDFLGNTASRPAAADEPGLCTLPG